jgi:Uma2 family endonuclease
MPPCGDRQALTVVDVVTTLGNWASSRPDFVVGTNEAGIRVGGDIRGADAAVWLRKDVRPTTGGSTRALPVLVVEVGGRYEHERQLREKARDYLEAGVEAVWLLLPHSCEIVVSSSAGESRLVRGETLPFHPALPALAPAVDTLFRQVIAPTES